MAAKPKLSEVTAEHEHAERTVPRYDNLTFFRGNAIESMSEADLRNTVRELLAALREIAGAQSERQVARVIERLGL